MDGYPGDKVRNGAYDPVCVTSCGSVDLFPTYFRLYAGQAALSSPSAPPDMMEGEAKLAFALRQFIADYLLASCFGEARHLSSQCPHEAYYKRDPSLREKLAPIVKWCGHPRQSSALGLWTWWQGTPEEACSFLEWIFSDFVWAQSFGGPNWGYIANMAGEMYRSISLISETSLVDCMIQIDRVAHLIHTGAPILTNPKFPWLSASPWVNKLMGFKRHAMWCCWYHAILKFNPAGLYSSPVTALLRDMPRDHTSSAMCKVLDYCMDTLPQDTQQLEYSSTKLATRENVCYDCMTVMDGPYCKNACEVCHVCNETPHTWHCPLFYSWENNCCNGQVWREHTHCPDCSSIVYKDAGIERKTCRCYCLWCGESGKCDAYCHTTGLYRGGRNRRYRLLRSTPAAIRHLECRKDEEYVRQVLAKEAKRFPTPRVTKWLKAYGLDRYGNPNPLPGQGGSSPVVPEVGA